MDDWKDQLSLVYSTNDDIQDKILHPQNERIETPLPSEQKLRIALDKRNRKGKQVTVVADFKGAEEDLHELSRQLKRKLGVGGSTKDGEIIIQGDFRNQVHKILTEMGYKSRII